MLWPALTGTTLIQFLINLEEGNKDKLANISNNSLNVETNLTWNTVKRVVLSDFNEV